MNIPSALPPDNANHSSGRVQTGLATMTAWLRRLLGRADAGDTPPGSQHADPGEDCLHDLEDTFSSEIFMQLLLELPAHRRDIAASWQAGDLVQLRSHVHRLLGAVVYCDAPELEESLRELRRTLHSGDAPGIALQHARALEVIDSTLNCSGYR